MRCPECDKDDLEEIKIDVDGEFSLPFYMYDLIVQHTMPLILLKGI